ncbi:hypothetical protein KCV01_g16036, partial [Aureobasidium melanogenum]
MAKKLPSQPAVSDGYGHRSSRKRNYLLGVWQSIVDVVHALGVFSRELSNRGVNNSIFARVDVNPDIPVAKDIVGDPDNPNGPKKVIPRFDDAGDPIETIRITCPKWDKSDPEDDAYAFVLMPGDDPENPNELIAFSNLVKAGDFPGDADLEFELVLADLNVAEGRDIAFDLYVGQGSDIGNPYVSNLYAFRVDKQKPGADVPGFTSVILEDSDIRNGVTRAQLEASGGLHVIVFAYYKFQHDDEISIRFIKTDGTTVDYDAGRMSETGLLDIRVPVEFFLDNDIDGRVQVLPLARDVAGNENVGIGHDIDTLIGSSPTGLQAIQVPAHDDDVGLKVIDLADAKANPVFIVPGFTTPIPTDRVRVRVKRNPTDATNAWEAVFPVVVGDPGDPVVSDNLTYDLIKSLGEGTDGLFDFTIDWELIRGAFTIPSNLPRTIHCDLRASGWGTELVAGVVRGPNSIVDNVIVPADSNGALTGTIPHLTKDATEAFLTNDRVTMFRSNMDGSNAVQIGTAQSATEGVDLTYPVPAGVLLDGTNYVYYETFRVNVGGANNTERSPIWVVTVTSSDGVPGAGTYIAITPWHFRDARQRPITTEPERLQPSMNYRRAHGNANDGTQYSDVIFRLYHYANMAQGDRIVLTVQGFNNRFASGEPAFTEDLATYVVSSADANGGNTVALPEDALIGKELPLFPNEPKPPVDEEKRFANIRISYDDII